MYSRPPSHSPRTFRKKKMFLLRFPSSTKASGQTRFIRSSLSTRCPAFSTSTSRASAAFGSQGNGRAVAHQNALLGVQAKRTERVEVLGLQRHTACHKFARNLPELWKDFETATELRCATSGDGCGLESRPAQILVRPSAPPQHRMSSWRPVRLGMAPRRWTGTAFLPTNRKRKRRQYEIQEMDVCCRNDAYSPRWPCRLAWQRKTTHRKITNPSTISTSSSTLGHFGGPNQPRSELLSV